MYTTIETMHHVNQLRAPTITALFLVLKSRQHLSLHSFHTQDTQCVRLHRRVGTSILDDLTIGLTPASPSPCVWLEIVESSNYSFIISWWRFSHPLKTDHETSVDRTYTIGQCHISFSLHISYVVAIFSLLHACVQ